MLMNEHTKNALLAVFFLGGFAAVFTELVVVNGIDSLRLRKSLLASRTICLSVLISLGYAVLVLATNQWTDLDFLIDLVIFPVGVGIGLSPAVFVGLVLFVLVYEHFLGPIASWVKRKKRSALERQAKLEAALRAKQHEAERRRADAERARIERIENERRAIERAHSEKQAASAQKLRDDARAECEVYFNLHAPEIRSRFPRSKFDDFVNRYMGDNRSADDVQERAAQLLGILEQHLHRVEPPREKSLETIVAAFEHRKDRVRAASIDAQDQELLLSQLDTQREEAIRRAMIDGTL